MDFKTIEGVPIVGTGTYPLGSGQTTFSADDLKAAVMASNDSTVSAPRIKIGHKDPRFAAAAADLDGEPAMGTVKNMRLSDDGQTIVADLTNMPAWLADSMTSAYPGRSIEGGFNYTAPSGHEYGLVISALSLLGTEWPGVSSLDDLQEVLQKNGEVPAAVAAGSGFKLAGGTVESFVEAKVGKPGEEPKPEPVVAKVDVGTLPRRFATDLRGGKVPTIGGAGEQGKWWPRSVEAADDGALSMIVDDASGKLISLPIKVEGDGLTYGTPTFVVPGSAPVAANASGPRVLAAWAMNTEPAQEAKTMKIGDAEVEQAVVAKSLGLAEDADEATILAKLGGKTEPAKETPVAASAAALPEGAVIIDGDALKALQANAGAGATAFKTLSERERDEAISSAIKGGRITAKSREVWQKRWETAPEETRTLLTATVEAGGLAPVIPVEAREVGRSGDGEGDSTADEALEAAFDRRFFPELATTTTEAA